MRLHHTLPLAVLLGLAGCGDPVTQIVVIVGSDLDVPDELDTVRFEAGVRDAAHSVEVDVRVGYEGDGVAGPENPRLPLTFTLVPAEGVRNIELEITGLADGGATPVVSRTAKVSFTPGQSLQLRMDLLRSCIGVTCMLEGETCNAGRCESEEREGEPLDPATFPLPDAGPGSVADGGVDGGPGFTPETTCDGVDDDMDGVVDEGDVTTQCGTITNGSFTCDGTDGCTPSCNSGFDDCDGDATECETPVTDDPSNCGTCGTTCGWGLSCDSSSCDEVVDMALGFEHTCAMTRLGKVYCWGNNGVGQIGNGIDDGPNVTAPFKAFPTTPTGAGATTIASFNNHTCVSDSDNDAWCWGEDFAGQLGVDSDPRIGIVVSPTRIAALEPATVEGVSAGSEHSCALVAENGRVYCSGGNGLDQLSGGLPTSGIRLPTFPSGFVQGLMNADEIDSGANHSCARVGGEVHCWGDATQGRLGRSGVGSSAAQVIDAAGAAVTDADAISVGEHTTCVLRGRTINCFGGNVHGEVGNGTSTPVRRAGAEPMTEVTRTMPVAMPIRDWTQVSTGWIHTCAINTSDEVRCWGWAGSGRLGNGDTVEGSAAVPVLNPLPPIAGLSARLVVAGYRHTCAVDLAGDVFCWGDNISGQLGDGNEGIGVVEGRPVAVLPAP